MLLLFAMYGVDSKHLTYFTNKNLFNQYSHQSQTAHLDTAVKQNVKGDWRYQAGGPKKQNKTK